MLEACGWREVGVHHRHAPPRRRVEGRGRRRAPGRRGGGATRSRGHTLETWPKPRGCGSRSPRSTPPSATSTATRAWSQSGSTRARDAGARPRRLARARAHRLPARGPLPEAALPRGLPARRSTALARRSTGSSPWSGFPRARPRRPTTPPAVLADRRGARPSTGRCLLPNYGVFDERRYFEPGDEPRARRGSAAFAVGLTICEDFWFAGPPASVEAAAGASSIVNPSASPVPPRQGRASASRWWPTGPASTGPPFAFCNLVGGQDELVFDGHSFVVDRGDVARGRSSRGAPRLRPRVRGPRSRPSVGDVSQLERRGPAGRRAVAEPLDDLAEVYEALRLGLATTCEERLRARARRALGRDRLGPRGAARRRRARRRAADLCRHAVAPLERATQADARDDRRNLGAS